MLTSNDSSTPEFYEICFSYYFVDYGGSEKISKISGILPKYISKLKCYKFEL